MNHLAFGWPSIARLAGDLLSPGRSRGALTVLTFHNVVKSGLGVVPGDLSQQQFESIIDVVGSLGIVMPLKAAMQALHADALPSRAVALTFDDGYASWIETVCPVLLKKKMAATFFLSTDQLKGHVHWHERVTSAILDCADIDISLPNGLGHIWRGDALDMRLKLISEVQRKIKYLPTAERGATVGLIEQTLGKSLIEPNILDVSAVRRIARMGFEVGAHTCSHPILSNCTPADSLLEIRQSKEILEQAIDAPVTSFAYPNGRPGKDFTELHIEQVRACGYEMAVTTAPGVVKKKTDAFQLPRFAPWFASRGRIALQLGKNLLQKPSEMR